MRQPTPSLTDCMGFVLALGWEGPLIAALGWCHGEAAEVLTGLAMTALLWGRIGLPMIGAWRHRA